ncbi:MAG: hypothetical protein QF767_07020, partial [Alphaproteobacteria bacterium]|nr:hypothetical protein [Alphaproteobacteria bacterium]
MAARAVPTAAGGQRKADAAEAGIEIGDPRAGFSWRQFMRRQTGPHEALDGGLARRRRLQKGAGRRIDRDTGEP